MKSSLKIPYSHEGIARTDRIYISNELISDDFKTVTVYIGLICVLIYFKHIKMHILMTDNPGQNDHCITTIFLTKDDLHEHVIEESRNHLSPVLQPDICDPPNRISLEEE